MSDTVKIERPLFCRRPEDLGARIEQDHLGNSTEIRTRADDMNEVDMLLDFTTTLESDSVA